MRPSAIAPLAQPHLTAITMSLLAAACSLKSAELETTSIECTTNEDGTTTCSENEDRPDGDDGDQPDGDLSCSGTGCVSQCEYADSSFHCVITCENGLTCESTCREGNCQISCDCPDDGGGGGCEGEPTDECCQERPDDPACNPPCEDGSTDRDCYCQQNPDDPECAPPCPDGSSEEECNHCREDPDDPACAPRCDEGSTDEDCHCQENPDDPACSP